MALQVGPAGFSRRDRPEDSLADGSAERHPLGRARRLGFTPFGRPTRVVGPKDGAGAGVVRGGVEADLVPVGVVQRTHIPVDPAGATDVPGVWAAGNVAGLAETAIGSVGAGVRAAAAINADLVAEDTRRAVDARRNSFTPAMEREVCECVLGDRRHGL